MIIIWPSWLKSLLSLSRKSKIPPQGQLLKHFGRVFKKNSMRGWKIFPISHISMQDGYQLCIKFSVATVTYWCSFNSHRKRISLLICYKVNILQLPRWVNIKTKKKTKKQQKTTPNMVQYWSDDAWWWQRENPSRIDAYVRMTCTFDGFGGGKLDASFGIESNSNLGYTH